MVPAQKRLDADHGHVGEVEDRLIAEEELVRADGGLQVQLEFVPAVHGALYISDSKST